MRNKTLVIRYSERRDLVRIAWKLSPLLVLFLSTLSPLSQATLLENVPLDSWVYPVVDELYCQGLFPSLHKDVKPYTRGEMASSILEINLRQKEGRVKLTDSELWLLSKLNQEFKPELEELCQREERTGEDYSILRYGISPVAYSTVAEGDSSYGRLQARFEASLQFDKRFVLHDRVVIDSRAEKERRYGGREWKHHLTGVLDEAYANIDLRYFHLLVGRDHLRWGPGREDVLLLSDQIPPFDMIRMEGKVGACKLVWFATVLDQTYVPPVWGDFRADHGFWANRYLSGHRLDVKLKGGVEMGVSEVVVYGGENRLPELYYLNPLLPYYGEQFNRNTDDNLLWSLDFSLSTFKNKELYAELLIDDFQYDFKSEPNQTGFQLGLNFAEPAGWKRSYLNLEYTRINNWVYGQNKPWNVYTYQGLGMGSILGPDADRWHLGLSYHFNRDIDLCFCEEYRRKGEGRIETPQSVAVPSSKGFPSGVVEHANLIELMTTYQPNANLRLEVEGEYTWIKNPGNQAGKKEDSLAFKVKLSLNLWKERGL
jgi:hypothetical protein